MLGELPNQACNPTTKGGNKLTCMTIDCHCISLKPTPQSRSIANELISYAYSSESEGHRSCNNANKNVYWIYC